VALQYFTLFHVFISLVGIAAGFGALAGLVAGKLLPRWTAVYLATTAATSVTGFFFPFNGFTPGIALGIVSVPVLAAASYALYVRHLAGTGMRAMFVIGAVLAQYLNCLVLVTQLFQKVPAMAELAPTQSEPPFAATQLVVLAAFVWLGYAAIRRFPAPLGPGSGSPNE
jgi:hypothetical protein